MGKRGFGTDTIAIDIARWEARRIEDFGKLRALRNAGWKINKIALEFNVTPAEVKRALLKEGMH